MSVIENLFSLENKVALVTGASRGNGRAIASGLAAAGAAVISLDILKQRSRDGVEHYLCDITDLESVQKSLNYILNKYNKIDILVNNAGISQPSSFLDYPDDLWEKTYKVNLKAPFELMRRVGKIMKKCGTGGSIINITSLNSELAFPDNPAYVAFKGALKQLTKSAALDLGKYDIRVNNVGPGYFMTDMTKSSWQNPDQHGQRAQKTILGRWGEPNDLVGITIFLSSDASSYITGQDVYVDGGWLIKGL